MKTAPSLLEIQRQFCQALQAGETTSSVLRLVRQTGSRSNLERAEIYQDAYRIRMTESLRDDFPGVLAILGDGQFMELAESYLRQTPSRFANLAEYSLGFPAFVSFLSTEVARAAAFDLVEVLSLQAGDSARLNTLSAADVAAGVSYQIAKNPTLVTWSFGTEDFAACHTRVGVHVLPLSETEARLLSVMPENVAPDELAIICEAHDIDLGRALPQISQWMAAEVLFCKGASV